MKCCVKNNGIGFWKKREDQIGGVPKTMTNNMFKLVARCILVPSFSSSSSFPMYEEML